MARPVGFVFTRRNYSLILASVGLLVIGFLCMSGDSNGASDSFNAAIYSFRRITLAPVILMAGYILLIYAIMTVPRKPNRNRDA